MDTPEILILTGAGLAAAGLFVLGVLIGMLVANRRADRAYELEQQWREQAERDRQQRLLEQQQAAERMPASARVRPRPVSVTDNDPTRALVAPPAPRRRAHRRLD